MPVLLCPTQYSCNYGTASLSCEKFPTIAPGYRNDLFEDLEIVDGPCFHAL